MLSLIGAGVVISVVSTWVSGMIQSNKTAKVQAQVMRLQDEVRGVSRILRHGEVVWERPFFSGEANMSHSLDNLEHHHFKYAGFRRPGDVHVHFFGAATLSFSDGIRTQEGDVFEIAAEPFALPVRNPLARAVAAPMSKVRRL